MDPVTVTITTEAEMIGLLRGRCLDRGFEIQDLATSDLDNIIIDTALGPMVFSRICSDSTWI